MSALNLHLPSAAKQLNLSLYNCIFGPLRTKAKAKVKSQLEDGSSLWVVELPSALLIAARKFSALISWKFVRQKTASWAKRSDREGSTNKATNKNVDLIASLMGLRLVLMPARSLFSLRLPTASPACRTGSKDSIESDTIVRTDCRASCHCCNLKFESPAD